MRTHGLDSVLLDPPTMRVQHARLGTITINASDFDPAVHEQVGPLVDPEGDRRRAFEAGVAAHTSTARTKSCGSDYGVR